MNDAPTKDMAERDLQAVYDALNRVDMVSPTSISQP